MSAPESRPPVWPVDSVAGGTLLIEAVDDVDLVLQRLERSERFAELHIGSAALRIPMLLVDAVTHEQHGEALRIGNRFRLSEAGQGIEPAAAPW